MPTTLTLYFDTHPAVFLPGQNITGRLVVKCDKPKSCRAIEVKFEGHGRVEWSEDVTVERDNETGTETIYYVGSETYYTREYRVWGNGQKNELLPGTHTFNFSFPLPNEIPASFESKTGQVRHLCKAKMEIPWGMDKKSELPYTVAAIYDLNTDSQAKMPINCNKHKYLCCWCCKSGPLSLMVRIAHRGYVPGQKMIVNAEVSNKTNTRVLWSKMSIRQKINYRAEKSTSTETQTILEVSRPGIAAGDEDLWAGVEVTVPPLPPSHFKFCGIIDISYSVTFRVEPSDCHKSLDYTAPLIVGTIPLHEASGTSPPATTYPGIPSLPPAPGFVAKGMPGQPCHGNYEKK